jgi:glycine oxidase
MAEHSDVLVIGGGVIGLTSAYFLARAGLKVELVDQGDFGREASWAGAGILPPGNPGRAGTPIDQLRAQSAVMFAGLSAELREQTGIDNGYLRSGGLELLDASDESIAEAWRVEGVTYELVQEGELSRLEPALAKGSGPAYFLPDMAQLRNPRHVKALVAGCANRGVRLHPGCPVLGFESEAGHVNAARTARGRLVTDRFILATGSWTDALLAQFGWRPGIKPVRGQIALLNTGASVFHKILIQGRRYLVPRTDGRVLVGSTEENAGFDKRTTAEAIGDLLRFALALVPALSSAPVERCWAGLRPGTPDGLPFIGRVPSMDNVFVAAGHFRAGIQLSPATALLLEELLMEKQPTVPLEPFRLDRFSCSP